MAVTALFSTPVIVERLAVPDAALRALIEARHASDPGIQASNFGTWQSDRELLRWGGAGAEALAKQAAALADRHIVDIKAGGKPRHRWGLQMWATVAQAGGSTQFHCHPGALWSAVHYIDAGEPGQGGELALRDPRYPKTRMSAPDFRFRGDGAVEQDEHWITPETGMLVMLPAWLEHGVRPYHGDRPRISVAINLSVVPL